MKYLAPLAAGLLGSAALLVMVGGRWDGSAAPAAAAEKALSITDLMLVVHDGKGLLGQVRQAVRGTGPADDKVWKSVQARASVMVSLVESVLLRATPPKGDRASWRQKATAYHSAVKALASAAAKEDAGGAYETTTKLLRSCTPCHDAHQ